MDDLEKKVGKRLEDMETPSGGRYIWIDGVLYHIDEEFNYEEQPND